MAIPLRVLMVGDSEEDALLAVRELERGGYEPACRRVSEAGQMRAALHEGAWDLVIAGQDLPGFTPLTALEVLKESGKDLPFLLVAGSNGEETAAAAMEAGVGDYIPKGDLSRLAPAARRELRQAERRREHLRALEALRGSEEEARALARESAALAEIGRIISSTPKIELIYDRFADLARRLLPFDRLAVNLIDRRSGTFTISHVAGPVIAERKPGDSIALEGTAVSGVLEKRCSLVVREENRREVLEQYPKVSALLNAGFRSFIMTPLVCRDEVIGIFHVQSTRADQYGEAEAKLAERIGQQIAGALANARLFAEVRLIENQLRINESRYRILAENASDVIWTVDRSLRLTYLSPSVERLCGYPPQDFSKLPLDRVLTPESLSRVLEVRREMLLQGMRGEGVFSSPLTLELEAVHADGRRIWVETRLNALRGGGGEVEGFLGVSRDITGRKEDHLAIEESELFHRTVLEAASLAGEGVVVAQNQGDREAVPVFANEAACRIAGYGWEELRELSWFDLVSPRDRQESRERYRRRLKGEKITPLREIGITDKEGREIPVEVAASGTVLRGNSPVVFYFRDIRERKRAEAALRESEDKFKILAEDANVGITVIQEGAFQYVNPCFARIFGYEAEEMTGRMDPHDVILAEDWPIYEENLRKRYSGEVSSVRYEVRGVRKGGAVIRLEIYGARITYQGKKAIVGTVTDVTEKKMLEAQFRQAQKMEAIGTLAGGIAHDFNNLLMGIQGNISLILSDLIPSHPHHAHLKQVEDHVRSGADLAWQLLSFARKEKGEIKAADLNEILKKTLTLFGRTKKEITQRLLLQEGLWPAEVDRVQMEQVFLNLLVNAWQAMPGGGEIRICTENALIDETQARPFFVRPGKYLKISLADSGVGMDEQTQSRIFEPFFTTKEMGRGTGLGLATVYGIVKGHGGFINVQSEKGRGTTFTLYLPATEKKVERVKKPPAELLCGHETLLLVDDEETVLQACRMLLERLGYRVLLARSGGEAIEAYRTHWEKIALVLLDLILPGMGSREVFSRLRTINPEVKVVLSSGYSPDGLAQQILGEGGRAFLQKPFSLRDLSVKVREVLDR